MKLITAIVQPEKLDVAAIAKHARIGTIGDGEIWVTPVGGAMRVRR
jgi:nitrogen regulatory protein PII